MIPADDRCSSTKVHFPTFAAAQARLFEICANPQTWRAYQPNRVIDCSECGRYVLTSRLRQKPSYGQRSGQRRNDRKKSKTKNR
jgi:hypothetical protein